MTIDMRQTTLTRSRYDRLAGIYDPMEALIEQFGFRRWRERLWGRLRGEHMRILEVGVGTGKNMPYYPPDAEVTAVDLGGKMLAQARERARRLGLEVDLRPMDVQRLDFPDDSFDAAMATFVFCSVPDPVLGLRELAQVGRPGGQIILLEHVRGDRPLIGRLMDLLNPIVVRVMGANINRRTTESVKKAGLEIEQAEELASGGLVKLIVAQSGKPGRELTTPTLEFRRGGCRE